MNILITTGIFPPDIGGPANYVPRIAGWLVERGHRVHVVCWSDGIHEDDSKYNFPITRISRNGSWGLRSARTLQAIYRAGKNADVWFVNGLPTESQLLASLLGKKTLHKIVGDVAWERAIRFNWFHGTIDDFQNRKDIFGNYLLTVIRNFPLKLTRRIMVPSQYLAAIVCGWGVPKSNITIIYNSTDSIPIVTQVSLPPWSGKTVITICRLTPWKGVDRLIDIINSMPDLRIIILGDGPMRGQLEAQAQRLRLNDRVIFMGQRPKPEVQAVLKQCDLFVLNSTYEGLPHVILEAMMIGIPVIATRVGGTPEVVIHERTGLLVDPEDNEALHTAIERILQTPELRDQLVQQAFTLLKERFSQETCFLATEALLHEVAE